MANPRAGLPLVAVKSTEAAGVCKTEVKGTTFAGSGRDGAQASIRDGEQPKPKPSRAEPLSWADEAHRNAQWQKQVDFGKNTLAYQTYIKRVPKDKRRRDDPVTPEISRDMSKRQFDGQVRAWKKMLHRYDEVAKEELEEAQAGTSVASKKRDHMGALKEDGVEPSSCLGELSGGNAATGVGAAGACREGRRGRSRSAGGGAADGDAGTEARRGKGRTDEQAGKVISQEAAVARRKHAAGKENVQQPGEEEGCSGAGAGGGWSSRHDRLRVKAAPQSRWEQMQDEGSRDAWDEDIQL